MPRNAIRNEVRKIVRRRRVGDGATCVLCGETDPDVVIPGKNSRIVEAHHVVGRINNPDLTADLCLNDHRKVHVLMEEAGVDLRDEEHRTILEVIASILLALAVFFIQLGEKLREWADALLELIQALDAKYRGWRSLPEAYRP